MEVTADREVLFRGSLFAVERVCLRDANGSRYEREIVRHPGAVTVVARHDDPTGEHLVFIRNYRAAVDATLWELPAGKLEPDEDPAEAARRELREETGFDAGRIEPLGSFYTSPGFTDELMHVFAATELSAGEQDLQDGEQIEVRRVPAAEALAMIGGGQIRDGKTIAAIMLWLGTPDAAPVVRRGGGGRGAAGSAS